MGRFHISKLFFVVLFLLETARLCLCKNKSFDCFESERKTLLNLKKSFIEDPLHILSSWEGTDCCKWEGVSCNTSTGHVVKLDLQYSDFQNYNHRLIARGRDHPYYSHFQKYSYFQNYNRPLKARAINPYLSDHQYSHFQKYRYGLMARNINPYLCELKYLIHLDLSGNDFQGSTIPRFFGLMKQLEYLNLTGANITGMVPHQLGNLANLRVLDLHVRGELSIENLNWFSRLKSLQYLDMSGTNLSGARNLMQVLNTLPSLLELRMSNCMLNDSHLPPPFVNSTFLFAIQHLDLSLNLFSKGPLPIFLQNMTSLRVLDLSDNSFNSSIPLWLGNLKNLEHLNLAKNQFNGHIPASIGNLSSLEYLDLYSNQLNGVIPATVGNLSALRYLGLALNQLSGVIPATIGNLSALRYLGLSSNQLNGVIPATIGNLLALGNLGLSYNQLNGVIPATIGDLSALGYLGLSSNQLNGVIPVTIGNLSALRRLDLSSNQLNGVIPECLGQLSNLEFINLGSNSLEGALSEIHFSNLSKLYYFHIGYNHLSLNVKPEWVPPFQLRLVDLSSCKLWTPFPQWLETQKEVFELYLANASISGPLPNWMWSMQFRCLDLSHNRITGSLPRNIGDTFPTLEYFYVADNLINGTIPSSFCKIDTLISLDLSNNMVSGDIPNCWSGSNQLNALKLSSNELTGVIPISIGHLIELECLHLKNNSLGGEVPLSLRNCSRLKLLNLAQNRLSGNIPTWIGESLLSLQILRLQNNMFNGYIPRQLCQLNTLTILDLAVNNLSGTIPQCFGNFSGMVLQQTTDYKSQYFNKHWDEVIVNGIIESFNFTEAILEVSMDLSDNNLIGMIPEGLTVLFGLIRLNLSHNHFTGSIPKSIGNLTKLISLDFSTNRLSGNIPTSMSVLTSLSHLNLSYNNFSGKIPTGPQLQTLEDPSIYAGNLELCGAPLPERCPGDEPPQAPTPNRHEEKDKEDKSEKVWFYTIPALGYITGLWGALGVLLFKKSWRYAYFQLADNVIDWIYVRVAIKAAWLKKKMEKIHASNLIDAR